MTKESLNELECLFRDYNVPARGKGRRFPAPVKSRILAMMREGVNLPALSRASGISITTLCAWKKKSASQPFQRIEIIDRQSSGEKKIRLYLGEKAWIELDEASIGDGVLQKIRAFL